MPVAISNGISRIRYAKKNELTEHALSAYSCRDVRNWTTGTTDIALLYPVKGVSFQGVLANVLQQPHEVHLPSRKHSCRQLFERGRKLTGK